jgi:hypothetical protein
MDKYELRRTKLLALINQMGRGGRVRLSQAIGKSPDYISRMLYPKSKAGHKGIGEDSVELIEKAFPGWLGTNEALPLQARKPSAEYKVTAKAWPFKTISEAEWAEIPDSLRQVLERQIRAALPLGAQDSADAGQQETVEKLAA